MSSDSTLTDEERLVLLCSKPALRNAEVEDFRQLMAAHMDWSRVFGMLHTHGVMGTAWQNIERYFLVKGTEKAVYGKFVSSVKQMYHMQKMRGEQQCRFTLDICHELDKRSIQYSLLKGIVLSQVAYGDLGSRDFKDNDMLIHSSQIDEAIAIMKEMGYVQGMINYKTNSVTPLPRREIMIRSMVSHEVIPLIKYIENSPFLEYHALDLQFSLDLMTSRRTDTAVQQMLERSQIIDVAGHPVRTLEWEDLLLFMLIHLTREATSELDVMAYKDILLYKFMDIHRFLDSPQVNVDWDKVLQRAQDLNFQKEVFYALHYTQILYGEAGPEGFLDKLNIEDWEFLDQVYRYNSEDIAIRWQNSFEERLFDTNRPFKLQKSNPIVPGKR